MNESQITSSRDQLLHVLRKRRWVLVQLVIVGAAIGVALALSSPQGYEATATVLIESGSGAGSSGSDPQGRLSTVAAGRLVRTRGVAERVRRELGERRSAAELLGEISAEADENGGFVNVVAHDDSPAGAARLANAFAHQFIAVRASSVGARVQRTVEAGERRFAGLPRGSRERSKLRSEIVELRATALLRGIDAEVVDPAVAGAPRPDGRPLEYGLVGAGLGLLLGLVLAFSLEALDPRLRRLEELRSLTAAPQLAATPSPKRRSRRRRRQPPVLTAPPEPFEHLRAALLVRTGEDALRQIVVTSPNDRGDGKTAVAANLTLSLARIGLRVCAVDTDLRHPGLASQFGLDDTAIGFADAIRGRPLSDAVQRFTVPAAASDNGSAPAEPMEIGVIGAGHERAGAAELLSGEGAHAVLEAISLEYDVAVLDCAPILDVSDALPLLESVSGAILVVRERHTPRRAIARAEEVVADAQGSLLGLVATGVPKRELTAEGYGRWPSASRRPARVA